MSILAAFHWTTGYVGIPFREFGREATGCDCWGLVKLVYRDELGIELPDYLGQYASTDERAQLQALIGGGKVARPWLKVTGRAAPMDVLVFRRGRLESHVGLAIDDHSMLHVAAEEHSKIERLDVGQWRHRLTGVYRHEARL